MEEDEEEEQKRKNTHRIAAAAAAAVVATITTAYEYSIWRVYDIARRLEERERARRRAETEWKLGSVKH